MANLRALGFLVCFIGALFERAPSEHVVANDNRAPAGRLERGVLTLHLRITHGVWHPDGDDDPGIDVAAFAEDGHAPSIPGPLIRVPVGTVIRTTVSNALADSSVVLYGLSGARGMGDTVRLMPGETRTLVTHVAAAGTFMYRGLMHVRNATDDPRPGDDGVLGGALVVDPPGATVRDRVLVLFQWIDTLRVRETPGFTAELLSINGKSWPHTERLEYQLGDTIRWRVVNASFDTHPMHLHGAFFTMSSHGDMQVDTAIAPDRRRAEVTERLGPISTMTVAWLPAHAGRWLFHCHLNYHLMAHTAFAGAAPAKAMGGMGNMDDMDDVDSLSPPRMGGLVTGVIVHGPIHYDTRPHRPLRLVAEQYDSVPGEFEPPFSYEVNGARAMTIPGGPIVVTQNEPIAITVVNHLSEPTSVHWHGLEIQSYYDGVPGFDGDGARIERAIAPGDSFVVLMTPPRAGTFIYHSHYDDIRQQGGGLYGAFIVLPPGVRWDPAHERVIVLGNARDARLLKINGVDHPRIEMQRGETYRLRLVNITLAQPNVTMAITRDRTLQRWRPVARDGADLASPQVRDAPAKLPVTIGETDDVMYTPDRSGDYTLEVRSGRGKLLQSGTIAVAGPP